MIVICEECGKKYRVDPDKLKGGQANFKCRACGHVITARKPRPAQETKDVQAEDPTQPQTPPDLPETEEPAPKEKTSATDALRSQKFRFGLIFKTVIIMVLVSIVPLFVFGLFIFNSANDRVRKDTEQLIEQVSVDLGAYTNEWLDKNIKVLKALSHMPDIISMDRTKQEPLLKALQKEYPWMYLVYTIGPDGMNTARSDGKILRDYSDRMYFRSIMKGKSLAWQTLDGKTSKKSTLVLAVPIKSGNQTVGIMAGAVTLDTLYKQFVKWRQGEYALAYLTNEKNEVVVHKNRALMRQRKDLSADPMLSAYKRGERGIISFKNKEGATVLGKVTKTILGWSLGVQKEETKALALFQEAQMLGYIILGGWGLIVIVIAYFSSRAMSRPILQLTDAANRISVGELDVKIQTGRKDEIGDLAEAISRMQDSIRLSIDRLRRRRR